MSDEYGIPGHWSEAIQDAESFVNDDEVFEVGQGRYVELSSATMLNPASMEAHHAVRKELDNHQQSIDLLVGLQVQQSKANEINASMSNDLKECVKLHGETLSKHGKAINDNKADADEKLNELNTRTVTVEKRMELWEKQYPLTINAQQASAAVEEIPRLGDRHGLRAAIPITHAPGTEVRVKVSKSNRIAGEDRGMNGCTREPRTTARRKVKPSKCRYCLKQLSCIGSLRRHVRLTCTAAPLEKQLPDRRMDCENCKQSFAVGYMSLHLKSTCPMKKPRGPE